MTLTQAMKALRAAGTPENRRTFQRHGARGEVFGVGFASLDALAKRVGRSNALAVALWKSKVADAQLLAVRVADPNRLSKAQLFAWAKTLSWYVGADALAKLISETPHARAVCLALIDDKGEWPARAGWHGLALLTRDRSLPDEFFAPLLSRIEKTIARAPNRVRDAMNATLIAIGIRSAAFAKLATATAKRIGPVEVDHGDTDCTTPNAALYIRRARRWLARQAARRARPRRSTKKTAAQRSKAKPKRTNAPRRKR